MKSPKNIDKLIQEAWEIEREDARSAGRLGFMARALTIATMPHKKPDEHVFKRRNGAFSLTMLADPDIGLPYGSIPRLLMAWMTTEALRTKERVLVLGPTLSGFMQELDLIPTGGRWGSITRLRDQMRRLFSCSIRGDWADKHRDEMTNFTVASRAQLWWSPKAPEQAGLWKSTVTLNYDFFQEIVTRPVPVDLGALKALKRSPMALDIYCWLTHRVSYMRESSEIPWPVLQMQFGSGYATDAQGQRDFRKAFRQHLKKVMTVYRPEPPKVEETSERLLLRPSSPHILPAKR